MLTAPPASRAVTSMPSWTRQFVGKPFLEYRAHSTQIPGVLGEFVRATKVLGRPAGYESIEAARAAVAQLHPIPPLDPASPVTDEARAALPTAVAYIAAEDGHVAALKLDSPVVSTKGWFGDRSWSAARSVEPWQELLVAVDTAMGTIRFR